MKKADGFFAVGSKDNHDKHYAYMIACFHSEVSTRTFPDKKERNCSSAKSFCCHEFTECVAKHRHESRRMWRVVHGTTSRKVVVWQCFLCSLGCAEYKWRSSANKRIGNAAGREIMSYCKVKPSISLDGRINAMENPIKLDGYSACRIWGCDIKTVASFPRYLRRNVADRLCTLQQIS